MKYSDIFEQGIADLQNLMDVDFKVIYNLKQNLENASEDAVEKDQRSEHPVIDRTKLNMILTGDDPDHLDKIVKAYAKTLKGMGNAFDREDDQADIPITQSSWKKILSDHNAVSDEDGKTAMQALIDSAKGGFLVMDLSDDTAVLLNGPAYIAAYDLLVDYLLDSSTWVESPVVIFTGRQSQIESVFKNDRLLDTLFEDNMRFALEESSRVSITPAPQCALPSRAPILKRRQPKL